MRTRDAFLGFAIVSVLAGCATTLDKARDARDVGEYDEARTLYEEAMTDAELEPAARRELAQMYVERGEAAESSNPQVAEREFRQSLTVDAVYEPALTALVRLLRAQGRIRDARLAIDGARKSGDCPTCNRLELVVLLEEADAAAQAGRWQEALAGYQEAQKVRPQPAVALSIVQAEFELKRNSQAVLSMRRAMSLMGDADSSALQRFFALRLQLFNAAISAPDVALADQVRALELANEDRAALFSMELQVADHVLDNVDGELALARYESMLGREGERALTVEQSDTVKSRVARIYANRGTALLNEGKSTNADWAFKRAIEIRPDDWSLKLQRVIAISESVGSDKAMRSLDGVPEGTYGLETTRGIVAALHVRELVARGELEAAQTALAEVQAKYGDVPEGHLAAAMVLAKTPVEGLSKRERKTALGSKAIVFYPGDAINRYAEAKAELAWVELAMAATDKDKLFIAPWLSSELARLERELAIAYPPEVEFRADPEPVIVVHNAGSGFIDFEVSGDGIEESLGIPSGDRVELVIPGPGLVNFVINGVKKVFVAEPYAKVTLRL